MRLWVDKGFSISFSGPLRKPAEAILELLGLSEECQVLLHFLKYSRLVGRKSRMKPLASTSGLHSLELSWKWSENHLSGIRM